MFVEHTWGVHFLRLQWLSVRMIPLKSKLWSGLGQRLDLQWVKNMHNSWIFCWEDHGVKIPHCHFPVYFYSLLLFSLQQYIVLLFSVLLLCSQTKLSVHRVVSSTFIQRAGFHRLFTSQDVLCVQAQWRYER